MQEQDRLQRANELLSVIASCGRRFFHHHQRVGRFEVCQRGFVWFIDEYNEASIYTHYRGRWKKFTGGGTLRRLVEHLREFIKRGTPVPDNNFGPWPEWICGGDLWGYGDDMQQVRDAAKRLGVVTTRTTKEDAMSNPNGDWYCPSCDAYIVDSRVTFQETCDLCGADVEFHEADCIETETTEEPTQ